MSLHRAVVDVVPRALARDGGVERVMEVIVPLGLHPEAARADRSDEPWIVVRALGDEKAVTQVAHDFGQFGQERGGIAIDDLVHRIEPEPIDVEGGDPLPRVLHEIGAHLVGARVVEVDRRAPGGAVAVGEIRTEGGQDVAFGTEVVVDDIEDDIKAPEVAGIDKSLQPGRTAVRVLHCEGETPRRSPSCADPGIGPPA